MMLSGRGERKRKAASFTKILLSAGKRGEQAPGSLLLGWIQPDVAYFKPQMRLFFFYGEEGGRRPKSRGPAPCPSQELEAPVAGKPFPSEAITGLHCSGLRFPRRRLLFREPVEFVECLLQDRFLF